MKYNNFISFNETPMANQVVLKNLNDLGVTTDGINVSIGDIMLLLKLNYNITIYIVNPTEEYPTMEFWVCDDELNVTFISQTVKPKLGLIQLNFLMYKILKWLLYKYQIIKEIDGQKCKYEDSALNELKKYIKENVENK